MNKTDQLVSLIDKGKLRINSIGRIERKTLSGDWVTDTRWRKDVVFRAICQIHNKNLCA